jgi:hypothetical protein
MAAHVEYLGFKAQKKTREYSLRVREVGAEVRDFLVVIDIDAFLSNRVRYQDAPEICFLKLQHALDACPEGKEPARTLRVTDADLDDYRVAHSPKPKLSGLPKAH